MPLSINSKTSAASQIMATAELVRLTSHLEGKAGTLILIEKKDGRLTIERKIWYQFWKSPTLKQTQDVAKYIESLLQYAYSSTKLDSTENNLLNYLTDHQENVQAEVVATQLAKLGPALSFIIAPKVQPKTLPTEVRKIHHLDYFLKKELGITQRETPIGEGNFGKVYAVTVGVDSTSYVYKIPKAVETAENLVNMAAATEVHDWTKHGDIAAAQVKKIQAMTQTKFFIIAHTPDATFYQRDFYYVPADQVEVLKEKLSTTSSHAEMLVVGQLMTKASGQEVEQLLTQGTNFSPGGKNFKNVVCGIFGFLEQAREADFVHRDIAPKNLMFNEQTGVLTIIDFGTSEKLEGKKSQRRTGSPEYMAPCVNQAKEHGSEVDFFSSAMTLLTLINPEEFKKFADARQDALKKESTDEILLRNPALNENLLDVYLKTIADPITGSSSTAKALDANPKVKELIALAFEVSEGGEKGEAAFPKWQVAFLEFRILGEGTSLADVDSDSDSYSDYSQSDVETDSGEE